MAVNKVVFSENTIMDISDSTVTSETLVQGVTAYSANGEKITGVLNPLQSELIWENASPDSSFEPQTITLDLSQYEQIEIIFKVSDANTFMSWSGNGYEVPMVLSVGAVRSVSVPRLGGDRVGHAIVISTFRQVRVNTTGIDFDYSWGMVGAGYAAMSTDNGCYVPLKIYGIKEVTE